MIERNENGIFIIENDKVIINPKALFIPEFAVIHGRDRSTGKRRALKEFRYIYFMADYKSEYNVYGLSKSRQLGLEIFDNKNYKPDPEVKAAIDTYKFFQNTLSMRYLISVRNNVNNVIDFLDKFKLKDKDGDNYINPYADINKIMNTMKQVEDVLENLHKWEKKVFEEEEDMKIRGGGMLNVFEDRDTAVWITKK